MWDFPLWPLAGIFLLLFYCLFPSREPVMNVPTVKYSRFLPNFANRLIYYIVAPSLLKSGYEKYKHRPFRLLKADGDLIVLPIEYVEELRHLPASKLSSLDAQFTNVLGEYTEVLVESLLPSHTVQKRLTPALGRVIPRVIDELKYSFEVDVPQCKDWVSVNPYTLILSLINRAASRIIVGNDLCRNEKWLEISANYTMNVGMTVVLLRPFPNFLRPLVSRCLPSYWSLQKQVRAVKEELFVPLITSRREKQAQDPSAQKPDDFLQWMMDLADNDRDKEAEFMAHNLLMIVSLAVVHTSTMFMTHVLFDLIARPEYLEPLREEIRTALKDGWGNATQGSFLQMLKLDSFMKESQRFNPIGEVSMQRKTREPLTLSTGLVLPKGTHICFASGPIGRDPNIIPEPHPFDGFRWTNEKGKGTSLVTLSPIHTHFGYGRQACPGRFFASNTMKAILSRLLLEYDFEFEDGRVDRPSNLRNGEQIMPNISIKVLMKERDATG